MYGRQALRKSTLKYVLQRKLNITIMLLMASLFNTYHRCFILDVRSFFMFHTILCKCPFLHPKSQKQRPHQLPQQHVALISLFSQLFFFLPFFPSSSSPIPYPYPFRLLLRRLQWLLCLFFSFFPLYFYSSQTKYGQICVSQDIRKSRSSHDRSRVCNCSFIATP